MTLLICQCCGNKASFEQFTVEDDAKRAEAIICTLPQPVSAAIPGYLSLFRPQERSLCWRKACSVLESLRTLVSTGYVQVRGRADRDCPPRIWAQAMDTMVANRGRLTRPMPNHNYLRQVAHDLAGMDAAAREKAKIEAEQSGNLRTGVVNSGPARVASINPLARLMEGME